MKDISKIYDAPKSRVQFSEGQKSKGILDDHAVRQNVASKEGTIEHTPANDNHIANKKYVDDEIAALPAPIVYLLRDGSNANVNIDVGSYDFTTSGIIYGNAIGTGLDILHSATIGNHLTVGDNLTVGDTGTFGEAVVTGVSTVALEPINVKIENTSNHANARTGSTHYIDGNLTFDIVTSPVWAQFRGYNDDMYFTAHKNIHFRADFDSPTPGQITFQNPSGTILMNISATDVKVTTRSIEIENANNPYIFLHDTAGTTAYFQTLDGYIDIYPAGYNQNLVLKGGKVGVGAIPTVKFSVNEKAGMSAIGGHLIKLTNKTGGNTVQGQLVAVYSATAVDDAFKAAALNDDGVFGIVLDAGVSDGSEAWIIVSGIADVLMDAGGSARGDRIISSGNTAGSGEVWNVGGAVATHFQEIGHCIETRAGAGLARCVLHFN